ncbi:hypothetical protein LPJ55_000468 [Coemansia sp. RSA 990]|nr:hypothetical protein LPJ55_000468 [Coemansia sp. RSA 990]
MKLEAFYWPAGTRRLQAPFSLAYGALATSKDLSLLPLVYRWKPHSLPNHLNLETYNASFMTEPQSSKVPGVTTIQYLGPGLGFNGVDGRDPRGLVHTGVLSALLDDVTARVSLSNTPDKPAFTANFKLEYLHPVAVDSFVVLDAWVTKVDGRKTFIASYIADAITQQVLVKAESLFVCAV